MPASRDRDPPTVPKTWLAPHDRAVAVTEVESDALAAAAASGKLCPNRVAPSRNEDRYLVFVAQRISSRLVNDNLVAD
jgi:hypothetical protein